MADVKDQLSKEDWEFVAFAVQQRFNNARPKPSEGKPTKEFLAQEARVMRVLMDLAFPRGR